MLVGAGYIWLGWVGQLGLPLETVAGVGMFGASAGIWWMVGRWERAKRRWWKDWERVGNGMERDLKVSNSNIMRWRLAVK